MSIQNEAVNAAIQNGKGFLKQKVLGGYTTESVIKAIENTAHNVEDIGNREIAKLRMQLNAETGNLRKQLVEITNKNDKAEFNLKRTTEERNKAVEDLKNTSERLALALETKFGRPKALANGNFKVKRVNKNGASMTIEYALTKENKKVPLLYKVEDIDGYVRSTKLNPATGKPITTFTDTNGGHEYEYLSNGTKVKRVNVKKTTEKPIITGRQTLSETQDFAKIQRNYSDGSYELIDYNKQRAMIVGLQKFNNEGKMILVKKPINQNGHSGFEIIEYNPATGKKTKYSSFLDLGNGAKSGDTVWFDEGGQNFIKSERIDKFGFKRIAEAKIDEFGFVDTNHPKISYIYPKESPIKTAKFEFDNQFGINNEVLKLKDGREVILEINNNYNPTSATIITKGKVQTIQHRELYDFLEKIGYVGHESSSYRSTII